MAWPTLRGRGISVESAERRMSCASPSIGAPVHRRAQAQAAFDRVIDVADSQSHGGLHQSMTAKSSRKTRPSRVLWGWAHRVRCALFCPKFRCGSDVLTGSILPRSLGGPNDFVTDRALP